MVWVGPATELFSEEMVMEVIDFDFGFDIVDSFEDFVVGESLNMLDMMDKKVDIDNTGRTFHKDFVFLVPKAEIDFEIGAKVAAKNSNLVGVDYTIDHEILVFEILAKASWRQN